MKNSPLRLAPLTTSPTHARTLRALAVALALPLAAAACSDDDDDGAGSGTSGLHAGVVEGAADAHCVVDGTPRIVTVDENACVAGGHDAADGGAHAHTQALHDDEGFATMYNAAGNDDFCKYSLAWSANRAARDTDVTFTLTARHLATNAAVTDAEPFIEAFLDDTHPAPNSDATATERAPGVYEIGPLRFDAAGDWTVRFHLHHECADTETSPHGHGAFYFRVP